MTSRCARGNNGHRTFRRKAVRALERRGRPVHHLTVEDSGLLQITYTDGVRDLRWTHDPDVVRRRLAWPRGAIEVPPIWANWHGASEEGAGVINEPALDVECPVCHAPVGEPCDQLLPHLERRDAAGDPGMFGVLDLDGDGVVGALDPDDPGFWL